jgi:lipopolysaccharide transport system permease protein
VSVAELWLYRDLLVTLAGRDIKLRYRQTALGVVWVILQPLLAAAIFAFVFGRVAKMPSQGLPYMVFAYAGLLGWNAFNSTLTKAGSCIVQNSQLISKVYFPRLLLPLSTVGGTLLDFAVAACVMAVMMIAYRIVPGWPMLLLPVWLMLLVLGAVGLGLYTAALMVSYRDLQYAIPPLLQFLLYASPVAYSAAQVPARLQTYFYLNPLTGLLEAFRWSLLNRGDMRWGFIAYAAAMAVAMFIFGAVSFTKMEQKFADVI